MSITCCKDCTERHIGCHGSCQRYLDEVEAANAERERLRKQKKGENEADAVLHIAARKMWMRRAKKGRKEK